MVNYSEGIFLLEGLTSAIFTSILFGKKCVVVVSRPMNIVTFLRKNGETQKLVVDFLWGRDTFRKKIMEVVEDFGEKKLQQKL